MTHLKMFLAISFVISFLSCTHATRDVNEESTLKLNDLNRNAAQDFISKNYNAAISKYKEAIALKPDKIINYCGAGYTYLYKKNKDSALFYFNQAVKIDRSFYEGVAAVGMLKFESGNLADFTISMNQAIELSLDKAIKYPNAINHKLNFLFYNALLLDKEIFNKMLPSLIVKSKSEELLQPNNKYFSFVSNLKSLDRSVYIYKFCNPIDTQTRQ